MPPKRKTRIKKQQLHRPGDIVFTKLRGYPWWPAKIQDESKVPRHVIETRKKKRVSSDASTVFFFGSLDYAFMTEKMIRPFDPETVRKGISDDKFKNKDLVLALEQALDPCGLDFLFGTQKPQTAKRKKKQQRARTSSYSSPAESIETTEIGSGAIESTLLDDKEDLSSPSLSGTKTMKRTVNVDLDDDIGKTKRHKPDLVNSTIKSHKDTSLVKAQTPLYTSKSLEAARQKSVEYERCFRRIYVLRHKLQNLIYGKKSGAISVTDYSKIAAILTDIEKCEMTKELLKETQIGKIVRSGCGYQFDGDNTYKLQERFLGILKTWATALLDLNEENHHKPTPRPTKAVNIDLTCSTPSNSDSNTIDKITASGKQLRNALDNNKGYDTPPVEKEEGIIDIETTSPTISPVQDALQIDDDGKNEYTVTSEEGKAISTMAVDEEVSDLIHTNKISPKTTEPVDTRHDEDEAPQIAILPALPIDNDKESKSLPTNTETQPIGNVEVDGENKDHIRDTQNESETPAISIIDTIDVDGKSDASQTNTQSPPTVEHILQTCRNNDHSTTSNANSATTQPCHFTNFAANRTNNDGNVTQKMINSEDEMKSSTPTMGNDISLPQLFEQCDNGELQHQQQLHQQDEPSN